MGRSLSFNALFRKLPTYRRLEVSVRSQIRMASIRRPARRPPRGHQQPGTGPSQRLSQYGPSRSNGSQLGDEGAGAGAALDSSPSHLSWCSRLGVGAGRAELPPADRRAAEICSAPAREALAHPIPRAAGCPSCSPVGFAFRALVLFSQAPRDSPSRFRAPAVPGDGPATAPHSRPPDPRRISAALH